jgi:hypothetical protein
VDFQILIKIGCTFCVGLHQRNGTFMMRSSFQRESGRASTSMMIIRYFSFVSNNISLLVMYIILFVWIVWPRLNETGRWPFFGIWTFGNIVHECGCCTDICSFLFIGIAATFLKGWCYYPNRPGYPACWRSEPYRYSDTLDRSG